MKYLSILLVLLVSTMAFGADINDSNSTVDINDPNLLEKQMLTKQIADYNDAIIRLDSEPNKVISDNLTAIQHFLDNKNLGDDMRKMLRAAKFIYENNPQVWVNNRLTKYRAEKAKLEIRKAKLEENEVKDVKK